MTVVPMPHHDAVAEAGHGDNYLTHERGLRSWLLTLDHKRIALMYMMAILFAFLLGGVFAILLRTELLTPGPTFLRDSTQNRNFYNQMFTLHGAIMTFMFVIPGIPAIIGNFVLPLMLGAKDVAFPRLNLMSWYLYMAGGVFFVTTLFTGGLDTGWTFYTPYSTESSTAVAKATFGAFILGFSSILTGVNFIATIHMLRPAGMNWFRMPLMLWGLYATSIIQILATPVLAITLLLLIAERLLGVGIFDPKLGGDPVLYQHFFWFYSHPAVYIMILPAMGVISEVISPLARKHIFGYKAIAISSVAISFLGFLVWGHHMFTSGQSGVASTIFSLLTFAVAIPSAVKTFNWLATLYKGSIRLATPMIYVLGFLLLFGIGGLTGLFLGSMATDVHLHDTYFIVAHFHYVMMGSTLFAFLAGMHYWFPKFFGRMVNEFWGLVAAIFIFVGFNLTFMPQFIMGSLGMPRRYAEYLPKYTIYHQLSTVGSYILAVGLVITAISWVIALRRGPKAPQNPWGSNTLEWYTSSPPPHDNFKVEPVPGDPYDVEQWQWDEQGQEFVLAGPAHT